MNNNFYIYADELSLIEIVSNKAKVLLVGSDFGYGNFGDVAQLKGTIDFYQKNSKLEPIVVYNIDSISNAYFIEKRKKQLNVKSIIFISDKCLSFKDDFYLHLIEKANNFSLLHLYGGGFLNSMWGDCFLNFTEFFIDNLQLKNYVISGQQIEKEILPRLVQHVQKYRPLLFGVRDFESLTYLESVGIKGIYSFDDAYEQINKIAQKVPNNKLDKILAHFNISSYTNSENKLDYFNFLLTEIKRKNKVSKLIMFNAYDHKRLDVTDTLSVLKEFEDEFIYENYEIVHGTKFLYDTCSSESYDSLSVKLAISSSYHTTMLMQLCGTPCWLISSNNYYDQKRESLEVRQTFEEFIKEPFLPSFNNRIHLRKIFYKFLINLINETLKDKEFFCNIKYEQLDNKTSFLYFKNKIISVNDLKWQKEQTNKYWEESESLKQDLKWQKEQTNKYWEELEILKQDLKWQKEQTNKYWEELEILK